MKKGEPIISLEGALLCTLFCNVMEIYMVYIIVIVRFPLANGIKCVLSCEGVVCVLAAPL